MILQKIEDIQQRYDMLDAEINDLIDRLNHHDELEASNLVGEIGAKAIRLFKKLSNLHADILFTHKHKKEHHENNVAAFYLQKKSECLAKGEKVTETQLEAFINERLDFLNEKLEIKQLEAWLELIENNISIIQEIIMMVKKMAEIRTSLNLKLGNFDVGDL